VWTIGTWGEMLLITTSLVLVATCLILGCSASIGAEEEHLEEEHLAGPFFLTPPWWREQGRDTSD
jgi:hypothetical protein